MRTAEYAVVNYTAAVSSAHGVAAAKLAEDCSEWNSKRPMELPAISDHRGRIGDPNGQIATSWRHWDALTAESRCGILA